MSIHDNWLGINNYLFKIIRIIFTYMKKTIKGILNILDAIGKNLSVIFIGLMALAGIYFLLEALFDLLGLLG